MIKRLGRGGERGAARIAGVSIYLGQPCIHGHMTGLRYTANGACVDCVKEASRNNYDKDDARRRKAAYRARLQGTISNDAHDLGTALLDDL